MITKMKKLTFLVYHKEYEAFLNGVRELGVVHVAEKQQGVADNAELQDSIRLSSRLQATLKMLHGLGEAKETTPASAARGLEVLDEVDVLQSEKTKLQQQLQNYQKEKAALEPWGDFEPESLNLLHDAGFTVNFYCCSEGSYDEAWEEIYNAMIINCVSSRIYFITVTMNEVEIDLDAEQIKLPPYSLTRVQILCQETEQALADNDQKLAVLAEKEQPSLQAALKEVNTEIEFSQVILNTEATAATLYRMFAKNISATMKPILSLIQILAASTFFCGMLTGTFFGVSLYDINIPFLQYMKDHLFMDNNAMFQLSLILGVIQILFGMILKAVNQAIQFGFKYAVATIGWIVLLISCGVGFMLPEVMPLGGTVHLCILGVAAVMIFLFNSPGKNVFMNIGLGLWDSYNMATGLLGDVLSYVRLFALGLSGGILAGVFNSLAVGMSPDNVIVGPIVMVLIFVIGHAINMFMNVLGAMVHPMRLTFVEFFKNSGYEGGGKEYKPFKK